MMQSQKYTLKNLKDEETDWKELILLNEVTLLRHFSEVGLHYAYHEAEHNAWIVKTLVDKKQRYKFETCSSVPACFLIAETITGWQCPRLFTARPLTKSKYCLLFLSHTFVPFPRTSAMGYRP